MSLIPPPEWYTTHLRHSSVDYMMKNTVTVYSASSKRYETGVVRSRPVLAGVGAGVELLMRLRLLHCE